LLQAHNPLWSYVKDKWKFKSVSGKV
jgi:hypothetical protein